MPELMLAFAMHDVTPFHRQRIERAEAYFAEWGIEKATYLFIPDYHGEHPAKTAEFARWCGRPRSLTVDWFLHGYYHRECATARDPVEIRNIQELQRGPGEGEFAALDESTAEIRLRRGREIFSECLGHSPRGFVAPRWSLRTSLLPLLAQHGFTWTESRREILHLPEPTSQPSPVITWATRTPLRKAFSLAGVPLLRKWWNHAPLLRIAVHPFDFDHPATIRSIERTIVPAVRTRRQILYDELLAAPATNRR